jgi:DNA-binding MarR family transcriptional regulator
MMRNGMLNINETGTEEDAPRVPVGHGALVDEVMAEMAAIRATEQRGHFGGWVRKSVSMAHLHVLAALEAEGPRSVGRLARELDVSLASATGIVSRMEERGLVQRTRDRHDRRVVVVELTDAGRTVRAEIGRRGAAHLRTLLEALSEADLRHFLLGVRALRAARVRLAEAGGLGLGDDEPGPTAAGPRGEEHER